MTADQSQRAAEVLAAHWLVDIDPEDGPECQCGWQPDGHSRYYEQHDVHVAESLLDAGLIGGTNTLVVTDEAVRRAVHAAGGTGAVHPDLMRAGLEAAVPLLAVLEGPKCSGDPVGDWLRLDESPAASAQMIQWHAPQTAATLLEASKPTVVDREAAGEALKGHRMTSAGTAWKDMACACGWKGLDFWEHHESAVLAALYPKATEGKS